MFEEIENKRGQSKALTILTIFVLVATITGVAIAAYTWNFASENANTIGTGNISMSLLESNDVINWFNVAWSKFKSVGRAMKRGHIANNFMLYYII